jgi:hypothetical protein
VVTVTVRERGVGGGRLERALDRRRAGAAPGRWDAADKAPCSDGAGAPSSFRAAADLWKSFPALRLRPRNKSIPGALAMARWHATTEREGLR